MAQRVRLADVAEKVGVSTKTVSNVVNGTGWVSDPVKARIREAIEELGYRPNLAARQLRGGSSGLIALCVPNLGEPYFAEFASQFVDAAQGDRDVELAMLEGENLPALDGVVLSPLTLTAEDIASRRSTVPLVLIGEHGETLATAEVTHVGPDNTAAARAATQLLLADGRRRIAAVGLQTQAADTAQVRFRGYEQALAEAGIVVDPALLVEVDRFNRAEGSRAIEVLLDRGAPFDAVFCFNDSLAFGALHTLAVHGISVPAEVAVVGYDNIEEGRYTLPPLTSIDPGVADASSLILDTLLDPAHARGGHVTVPFSVVDRRV
jgi:DNA-binding LacI/PurR family transcriptional regulator